LKYIPATTGSFLMNLVPLLVVFGGVLWLQEAPTRWQVVGILIGLVGSALFFATGLETGEPLGIAIVGIGLVGIATYGILGRDIARGRQVDTLSLTALPLAFGGSILLLIAFVIEGFPELSTLAWVLVLFLAVVNTACVYALYNHALRTLAAFELSVILSLSPLVTAFWAWLLLGERLAGLQLIGIAIAILGVVLVQLGSAKSGVAQVKP
jgi:drug/metabolite transporter (DMT)-like permease